MKLRNLIEDLTLFIFLILTVSNASPSCDESYSYIEVAEDTAVGTIVKEIRCSLGTSNIGTLSYSIKDGNTHGKFGVNTVNGKGQVYVHQAISFESRTINFQLIIEVSDNSPEHSSTNYILDVQVTGVNDYAPLFLFSPYTVYVNENRRPGTVISNPIPYDFDKGADGATTSVILDGDDTLFYMDPTTAKVYLRSQLDYERQSDYVLTIQVTDNGLPERRSSTTNLNIHVKDVNDNPPICEHSYISETIDETKEAGSVIKYIKCTDADPGNNGRLTYTITDGDYTKFRLQGPYLILSKEIDVDKEANVWSITVVVRDRGNPRLSAVVDIVIYVEGVDDNVPVWAPPENGNYVIDIEEHSAVGKHIVRVSADDKDVNEQNAKVAYYIDDYSSVFTIKPTTGDIFLSHDLDRENGAVYTLPVSAVSNNNPVDRITTNVIINVVDINDNTPVFAKDVFQVALPESSPTKSTIATIAATDDDEGLNGDIQYIIVDGNPDSLFDVETQTGSITLLGHLDFETAPTHTVYLRASDRGRPTRWSTCTVIIYVEPVNEFEPIFKDMGAVFIPEDSDVGMSVFTIEATDGDNGLDGEVVYDIDHTEVRFAVEPRSGIVRLLTELDRETLPDFKTILIAKDSSQTTRKSGSITVDIKVVDKNDNPPVCSENFFSVQLSPPTASGDVVLTFNCSDIDSAANSKLSYAIISGNTNSDFSISADGSIVVMRKPSSAKYRLKVRVSDNGSPSFDTFALVIIETGGQPRFENFPKTLSVYENVGIGKSLFRVVARSVSDQLEYFIKNVTTNHQMLQTDIHIVNIDKFTGVVYTWNDLDREITDQYSMTIKVKEIVSGFEAEGTTNLIILDVNDNSPVFKKSVYNVSIMENIAVNSMVVTVEAEDADSNENAELDFAIVDGNDDNSFIINQNGEIIVRSQIDREKYEAFSLIVMANDRSKDQKLTSTTAVLITIIDIDEYAPEFINIGSDLETELKEDTPIAAKIFTMAARDLDVNRKLSYTIDDISKEHFIIDATTGDIFLSRFLDRETRDVHVLQVAAKEHDKTVTASITIRVLDVNDNDPTFDQNIYKFNVHEHASIGTVFGEITVNDVDDEENGMVSLSITKGNNANAFAINQNMLYINGILDFDTINEYLLELEARDSGIPQRTATSSVIIQVTPEYKSPKFVVKEDIVHLPENSHVGYLVYDADATLSGAKEGHGKDLIYSIENGNVNGIFSINRETGEISIARRLDKKLDQNNFDLFIFARNIYNPMLSDMLTLIIKIDDINDNIPTFERKSYTFNVKEDSKLGSSIGLLSASDSDQGQNAFITYELQRNEDTDTFRIDEFMGTLSLKKTLNYMYRTEYQFYVLAFDNGSPSLTGTAYVLVKVMDVNDKPPEFEKTNPTIHIRENYPIRRNVYQVKAIDGDTGVGGEVLYKITKGNEAGVFELDSETGDITVAKLLDRESVSSFTLLLEAEDKGTPSLTGTMTLSIVLNDINDNIPQFTETESEVSLDRFAAIETHVLSVTAVDNDDGTNAVIEYQILEEHDELFQIDAKTGHVFTFSDLSKVTDDISLTILATDYGMPRLTASVTVLIELHPPLSVEKDDYGFTVSEYSSPNTFVGSLATTIPSKYTILSGNYKKHFRISEDDGNIFLNDILDREEYTDYFLRVRSTNKQSPTIHKDLHVRIEVADENDNNPIFPKSQYEVNVLEHTPIGYSIASITATDADDADNGKLSYVIENNNRNNNGDADNVFLVTNEGTLRVKSSISYAMFDHLNFTIVAKDNGQFSRQASVRVYVRVINIDENAVSSTSKSNPAGMINLEMPSDANAGYIVGCLTPQMFDLNVTATKVYFIAQDDQNTLSVSVDTGCITLQTPIDLSDVRHFLIWVVAILKSSDDSHGRLALVRVDTFVPNSHVVILTHSVTKEVLELNRDLLLQRLQNIFPQNHPRIWKTEGYSTPFRRKLLSFGSKTYVYVIRNNNTQSVSGVQSKKEFLIQADILSELEDLEDQDGGVSHDLTSEDFDNFPVVSVDSYRHSRQQQMPWLLTSTGNVVMCLIAIVAIGCIIVSVIVCLKKKKRNSVKTANNIMERKPSLLVCPSRDQINPKYNNLRRSSSTADITPLMNALKVLSDMNESQRNSLIEQAMKSKKKDNEPKKENFRTKFLTKMKTLPLINITHVDEVTTPRKISNENAEEKTKSINEDKAIQKAAVISSPIAPFISTPDEEITSEKDDSVDKLRHEDPPSVEKTSNNDKFVEPRPTRLSSVPDDGSISSLDLDAMDTLEAKDEPEQETRSKDVNNGPIVVGGKEYDGVGEDITSGGKYLYNTTTGDKLHVTDDILKRAIEQRQSVVTNEFKDRQGVKLSVFKKPPMKRKQSRTRFSTTTIWEMNVDHENPHTDHDDDDIEPDTDEELEDVVFESDSKTSKQRRQGIDYSKMSMSDGRFSQEGQTNGISSCSADVSETDMNNSKQSSTKNVKGDERSNIDKNVITADVMRKYDYDDDGFLKRKISANKNWDNVLTECNVISKDEPRLTGDVNKTSKETEPGLMPDEAESIDVDNEKWSNAQQIVKFVRPIYKPLNLDNVTCKVPKGKSDRKDCLSKDPVYVGWAKMVGKRIKTKQVKKKDGTSKTVSFREGRSLPGNVEIPKDVLSYTKLVSNQLPPHQRRQSIAMFNNNAESSKA